MKHTYKVASRWTAVLLGMAAVVGVMVWLGRPVDISSIVIPGVSTVAENDHVTGMASSTLVLVEYSDFQCPACKAYYPAVHDMLQKYGNRIAFVYRNYPLTTLHPNAYAAAQAAEAASAQGKFWEMHDKLFTNQTTWTVLSDPEDTFVGYARDLGLDEKRFKDDYASDAVDMKIRADMESANRAQVQATPTFFLNGKQIPVAPKYADFQFYLDRELTNVITSSTASSTAP